MSAARVRALVARHPTTPAAVLGSLAPEFPQEVLANPALPLSQAIQRTLDRRGEGFYALMLEAPDPDAEAVGLAERGLELEARRHECLGHEPTTELAETTGCRGF